MIHVYSIIETSTPPKFNIAPEKWWLEYVGILLSFWEDLFLGVMLNFQGCYHVLLPLKNSLRLRLRLSDLSVRLRGDHDGRLVAILFDINETISLWFACVCFFFIFLRDGSMGWNSPLNHWGIFLFFSPNHRFQANPRWFCDWTLQ